MKKRFIWLLTASLILSMAGCSSAGTGSTTAAESRAEGTADGQAAEAGTEKPGPDDAGAKADVTEKASGEEETGEDVIDGFIFRTSDEMKTFMQDYNPDAELDWQDESWNMNGDEISMSGSLMSDEEHFLSLKVDAQKKTEEQRVPEVLLAAFQDICSKTGLVFEGAEEAIRNIVAIEDDSFFSSGDFSLHLSKTGGIYSFKLAPDHSEYVPIPYTPEQAEAYMQSVGGGAVKKTRQVNGTAYTITGQKPVFDWYGKLDDNNHLVNVYAEYSGENAEEGKAFFTEFAGFFLKDDVLSEGLKLISDSYDTLETAKSEKTEVGKYHIKLSYLNRDNGVFRYNIDISSMNVAADEKQFPNAEELSLLTLSHPERMGLDASSQFPETVLYEIGNSKIVLERSFFNTLSNLMLVLRMEGIPDGGRVLIDLEQINGVSVEMMTDEIDWFNNTAELDDDEPHDAVEKCYISIPLAVLKKAMDFTGFSSLTFSGRYFDAEGNMELLDEITVEAGQ